MKKYIIYFILILVTISCEDKNENQLHNKIQGDWVYYNVDGLLANYFVSFKDSLFFGYEHYNEFEPFYVKDDTVIIDNYESKFIVSRVTDKYIRFAYNPEIPFFYNSNINQNDNIEFISLEVRFIDFWQRGLLDWALHINENKECFISIKNKLVPRRIKNHLKYSIGNYKATLSEKDYSFLQSKFKNIQHSKIKKHYKSIASEDAGTEVLFSCEFKVKNINKIVNLSFHSRGTKGMPADLGIFINYLHKVFTFIDINESNDKHLFSLYSPKYPKISQHYDSVINRNRRN